MVNFIPPTDTVPTPIVRQIIREIAKGDVFYVSFQRLQQALVIDLRESEVDRPALMVARHVQTIEQQVRLVEDLRPGFATIQHFSSVPWGGSSGTARADEPGGGEVAIFMDATTPGETSAEG